MSSVPNTGAGAEAEDEAVSSPPPSETKAVSSPTPPETTAGSSPTPAQAEAVRLVLPSAEVVSSPPPAEAEAVSSLRAVGSSTLSSGGVSQQCPSASPRRPPLEETLPTADPSAPEASSSSDMDERSSGAPATPAAAGEAIGATGAMTANPSEERPEKEPPAPAACRSVGCADQDSSAVKEVDQHTCAAAGDDAELSDGGSSKKSEVEERTVTAAEAASLSLKVARREGSGSRPHPFASSHTAKNQSSGYDQ